LKQTEETTMSIPIIDISPLQTNNSPNLSTTIHQITTACQTHGFFAITNHNVSSVLLSKVWDDPRHFSI
jgi:isopenicillin N synthase-like dioxygenase